jgi:hypothetical protein
MTDPGKCSNYFFIHKDTYRFFSCALNWRLVGDMSQKKNKLDWRGPVPACLPACVPVGVIQFDSVIFFWHFFLDSRVQSEPGPTTAPTWMDDALIGFSFLSLCHPRFTFFCLPFLSPDLSFLLQLYFLPAPHPVFFFLWNFSRPPTYYPPLSPSNLLTYIFKLKVDSSPSTYSPIN